ncbi:cytochrome c-type biogenesis protein [Limnochorda pilosa]|uniref:Cytochrome c-type biogenesis protein n=1 Tax=Limnochorda pilosa TaxID=1555112 RepID=A0A0K2SQI4_LIMPI|nr:cytochrome c-type biogenesis protein CcmH [Limnochorda pilosa]BAS29252.1 hypothetical protein LIP_3440 [Limnochorda pilosa]
MRTVMLVAAILYALAGGMVQAEAPDARAEVRALEAALICQCGCGMVVKDCECSWAVGAREDFAARLGEGQTRDQILADYVAAYGETVLAAPTKQGFNLTAWILPFAAVMAGATLLVLLVRRWARPVLREEAAGPAAGLSDTERRLLEQRLAREMKDYL